MLPFNIIASGETVSEPAVEKKMKKWFENASSRIANLEKGNNSFGAKN